MRHHFQDHRYGYGVSSPLWDVVFRTLPRKRNCRGGGGPAVAGVPLGSLRVSFTLLQCE